MIKCPNCSFNDNPTTALVCQRCGYPLPSVQPKSVRTEMGMEPQISEHEAYDELFGDEPALPEYGMVVIEKDDEPPAREEHPEDEVRPDTVVSANARCPCCGQVVENEIPSHLCAICDTQLVPGSHYCHNCGTPVASNAPQLSLVMQGRSDTEAVRFRFEDAERRWLIGRTIEALNHYVDIDLAPYGGKGRGVSRTHAEIYFDPGAQHWVLMDVGSQFGTYVDNQQIEPRHLIYLQDGQFLRFGGLVFRVVME